MNPPYLIGLASVARAGKDTFARLLIEHLRILGHAAVSLAFADALKLELDAELLERHGISAFTQDSAQKTIIRPELVARGKQRRAETNGRHWIEQIDPIVRTHLDAGTSVIVTDVRYATHEDDECGWVQGLGGKVIYIQRLIGEGLPTVLGPANDEERDNDPLVKEAANLVVRWPTCSVEEQRVLVTNTWERFLALDA